MKKLLWTSFAAMAAALFSMTMVSCGHEEPGPSTGSGTGGGSSTVTVTGVSLNKTSLSLVEGGSETLTATVAPSNATNKAVSWSSSSSAVATVDNSGKVIAVKAGTATITVTTADGDKTATCAVTVTAKTISVTEVTLDKTELEITEGESTQLTATVKPDDASDKSVEWISSDETVATVDATGKVTAVKAGSATMTVKTRDGGKEASCAVTVKKKEIPVEGVTIEPTTAEVTEGETVQLNATINPADADQDVEWTTSDSQIATVDESGLVTALKPGTVYIVVRSKAYTDKQTSCEVTVKPDDSLKGIAFDASEIQLEAGQSRTLTVVFTPEYAANKNVTWASSDPSVASVKDGNVSGVKEGTATITATSEDGGHKAECVVTVSKASGPKVYAKHQGGAFTVNGVPDPMNGAFNNGDSFKYDWVSFAWAQGKDLYTLESYYSSYDGQQRWICKNRKPIIDVTDKFPSGRTSYNVVDFEARNGYFAILLTQDGNETITVIKAKEGDKNIETLDIPGQGSEFYSPAVAIAPNGDIHIATRVMDAFWNNFLGWFKIAGDWKFSQTYLKDPNEGNIGVTESGDVYVLTYQDEGVKYTGKLYKNGTLSKTIDSSEENFYSQLICVGNDVYTAVIDFPGKKVMIRKNGNTYQTVPLDAVSTFPAENSFWVTSDGDTYVCVTAHADWNDTKIYKNGKLLYKSDSFRSICVVEE